MSKSGKLLLGILSCLPIVFIGVYIIFFMGMFINMSTHAGSMQERPEMPLFMKNMIWLIALMVLAMLLSLGLLIYYIVHVVNNKLIDSNERLIWILIFVFANMIGYPIYWYMRIWKQPGAPESSQAIQ